MQLGPRKKLRVVEKTDYPIGGRIEITVQPNAPDRFVLNLRIPAWSAGTKVALNGKKIDAVRPGTYLALDRLWKPGDRILLTLDMRPRLWVKEPESAQAVSIYHGPILLAYDPRFDAYHPAKLPSLDVSSPPTTVTGAQHVPPPILLLRFRTEDGGSITLCDFASAGAAGNEYRSWLPARGLKAVPLDLDSPFRPPKP